MDMTGLTSERGRPKEADAQTMLIRVDSDYDKMGIQLNKTFDFGCGEAEIHGAIGDKNLLMLTYDLTADEEAQRFAQDNSVDEGAVRISLTCSSIEPAVISERNEPINCRWESYCSKEKVDEITIHRYTDIFFADIPQNGGTWHIHYDTLSLYGGGNRRDIPLEKPVELDIPLDFISLDRIELDPDAQVRIDNDIFHVTNMVVTPLAVRWEQQYIRSADTYSDATTPLVIHFKDGTEAVNYERVSSSDQSGIEVSTTDVILDTPIDINKLASVTIGDYTINLE